MRTKRIMRIHSPDSVNDNNWLKMIPKMDNRYGKRQSDTTHWNKNYEIVTAQQFPHKGPLNQHTCRNPNKIPKKGH